MRQVEKYFWSFFYKYSLKWCVYHIYHTLNKFTSITVCQNRKININKKNWYSVKCWAPKTLFSPIFTLMRPPMGYLGDGRLGLNSGRFGRIDPKYFGRWEIDLIREQRNGRNRKIHGSTYLGAGRLAVIKVGDERLSPPSHRRGGLTNARNGLVISSFWQIWRNVGLFQLHVWPVYCPF